jgi:exonuclease III
MCQYEKVYPNFKGFRIGHLNIASLVKHKNELLFFLAKLHFDVICINETRLDDSIYKSEAKIGSQVCFFLGGRGKGSIFVVLFPN